MLSEIILSYHLQAEKEGAELRKHINALEVHVEAKAGFMDAFDQLQNLPLIDGKTVGLGMFFHHQKSELYIFAPSFRVPHTEMSWRAYIGCGAICDRFGD